MKRLNKITQILRTTKHACVQTAWYSTIPQNKAKYKRTFESK